jgi:glycosyltransferase involved in cell wall biosynthesis
VVSTAGVDADSSDVPVRHVPVADVPALADQVDVVVVGGDLLDRHPALALGRARLVVDLYDPFHLEALEQTADLPPRHRRLAVDAAVRAMRTNALLGDVFLCASSEQRAMWVGHLAAHGRVNPETYDADPTLTRLLSVVPFGLPAPPEASAGGGLRAALPEIDDDSDVLYWGGGLYNWFDPAILVHAVARLARTRPTVRLVFAGGAHPNPDVRSGHAARAARAAAADLGVLGTHVFFLPDWVDYDRRADHLRDATLGVSTHLAHVETEFSYRTRLLDYVWAGIPTLATGGDPLSGLLESRGAGWTVPPGDADALHDRLAVVLADRPALDAARAATVALAPELRWGHVAAPLLEYCSAPTSAPDLLGRRRRTQVTRVRRLNASDRRRELRLAVGRRARTMIRPGASRVTTPTRER